MSTWTPTEDEVLSGTILDYLRRGVAIKDAIVKASKKLGKTMESCNGRWYDHLQAVFKGEVNTIRASVKRINDHGGEWTTREEERLTHMMVQLLIEDVGIAEALNQCAHSLSRSTSGCSSRWYNQILKRNKILIQDMIMEGKQKMVQAQSYTIPRNWEAEQENIAVGLMLQTLKGGETVQSAMEKVSKKLEKPISTVRSYWYSHLLPENEKAVDEVRGQKSFWDNEKRYELFAFITKTIADGEGITKALELAADHFHRQMKETHNLWYTHLRKDESFTKRYVAEQNKLNGVREPATISQPSAQSGVKAFFEKVEDEIVLEAVLESIRNGKQLPVAYSSAANLLQRSTSEIQARWTKTLQYEYMKEITKARREMEKPKTAEVPKVEATAEVVVEQPGEPKVEHHVEVQGFDITKVTDFLAQIQLLVSENERLTQQNAELQVKASKYDEMEVQNKQLSEAVERARQFLNLQLPASEAAN